MRKKIVICVVVAFFLIAGLYFYWTYFSEEAVIRRVDDVNRWNECRANFRDMYQKAGGNPYSMDGQLATDKYCGAKP
jgi:hypothetical protein